MVNFRHGQHAMEAIAMDILQVAALGRAHHQDQHVIRLLI